MALVNFGETNPVGDGTDSNNAGDALATAYTVVSSGTLVSLSFWVTSTAGQVNLGIYADLAGAPGALLASTGLFTPANGLNTVSVAGIPIVNGTTYWLAFSVSSNALTNPVFNGGVFVAHNVTAGALSNPFGTITFGPAAGHWTIFGTYDTGGGIGPGVPNQDSAPTERTTRARVDAWEPLASLGHVGVFSESPARTAASKVRPPENWDPLPAVATVALSIGWGFSQGQTAPLERAIVDSWEPLPSVIAAVLVDSPDVVPPRRAVALPDSWNPLPALAVQGLTAGVESASPLPPRRAVALPDSWNPLPALAVQGLTAGVESASPLPPRRAVALPDSWNPLPALAVQGLTAGVESASPLPPRRAVALPDSWNPIASLRGLELDTAQPTGRAPARAQVDGWDPLAALIPVIVGPFSVEQRSRASRANPGVPWEPLPNLPPPPPPLYIFQAPTQQHARRHRAEFDPWDPLPDLLPPPPIVIGTDPFWCAC